MLAVEGVDVRGGDLAYGVVLSWTVCGHIPSIVVADGDADVRAVFGGIAP